MTVFSEYIKLTGRGEKGRRPLTMPEAQQALTDYLMVMRPYYKWLCY